MLKKIDRTIGFLVTVYVMIGVIEFVDWVRKTFSKLK